MRLYIHASGRVIDASPEQIMKIRRLYERPGTPGEKQAAAEALKRLGVDPESASPTRRGFQVTLRNERESHGHLRAAPRRKQYTVTASSEEEAWSMARQRARSEYPGSDWSLEEMR
jgi:hypothetical protein